MRLIGRGPLRLLMTADAVGGVWQYATDLAGALADHGVETTLAVLGPAPSAQALSQAVAIPQTRIVITGLPLDWTAGSPGEVAEASRAIAALASAPISFISTVRRLPRTRGSRRRSSVSAIPVSRPGGGRSAPVRSHRTSSGARRCSRVAFAPPRPSPRRRRPSRR